jgi:hypothetical protein
MPTGPAEPGRDQQGAELVTVQADHMGLMSPRTATDLVAAWYDANMLANVKTQFVQHVTTGAKFSNGGGNSGGSRSA